MNYEYDKPIISQRRTGNSSSPYKSVTESLIINDDAKVILTEIPLEYDRVQVTGDNRAWYEIETGKPNSNQFKVNYINKIIEFDASNIGKQLTFTYTGTGLIYVPTSMIYTEENNGVVTQTLEDLTNEASESAQYAENQGDYAKQQGDYAKAEGEKVDEFVNNTTYVEPYNNATTYEKNNVVSYNGASFMAKQQTVGNLPPDPSVAEENEYWGLLSRRGADGNGTVATHEDRFIASEGQTVFNLSNTYDQFQNRTWVYVGGALQDYPENYEETTSTSITLSEGVPLGTEIVVKYFGESVPVESDIQNTVNNHTNVLANHSERLNQYQSDLTDTDATSGRQPDQSVWKEFEGRGVNVKWFGASGSDQETTGSIDAGSNTLTVTDPKDFKVGHGIVVKGAGEGGVAEEVELQINSVPTSDGNISISLDGTEYTFPVDNGESEAVSLEITGQPTVDGNVTVTLDNVSTNIPVDDGEYEVVSLNITGQPSVDGDIVINLDGIPTNVSVDNGVAEESSIEIISDPTTAGDVIVTLDGVDYNVTIDPLVETTASDVADKIRSTSFSGWTTGGTVGTSIVTFTSDTTGDRVDTIYNENGTGATGAVTTNVQGVDPDTETEVADKIRNTVFDGWTTSGVGAEVFFTATEKIEKTDAIYDDNGTGVTGTVTTITQGMSPDTTDEIATKIRNTTFNGWNTSGTGSHITFISDQTGVRDGITYSDNGTGVTGVTNVVNEGVNPDTTEEIATLIRGTEFEGWIVSGSDSVITFTSVLAEEKEDPVYSDGGTGVNGVINVLAEGIDGEDLLTEIVEVNGFDLTLFDKADTTVDNITIRHDDTRAIQSTIDKVHELGGGAVLFSDSRYIYSSDIYIKENVTLEGSEKTHLECRAKDSARLVVYNSVNLKNLIFDIPSDYDDSMLLFANKYLMSVNREEKSSSNCKVIVENVKAYTEYSSLTTNKVAMKFYATQSSVADATVAGFWGVTHRDLYLDGFNTMYDLETELTGWINGNVIDNVVVNNFEHAVKVKKSSESLGVDYNVFTMIIQTSPSTKEIFLDGVSSNNYTGCQIWDMRSHLNAKIGTGLIKNVMNGISYPKEKYATYLLSKKYHFLGTFSSFIGRVNHVMISLSSYDNYRTDYFIRGGDEKIEKRTYGTNRLDSGIQFFKRILPNGHVEIYLYNNLDIELESNIYIESFRSFYPAPRTTFENVDGLIEMTDIETFYPATHTSEGSNENGSWVKYADGTMICRATVSSQLTADFKTGNVFRNEHGEKWYFPQPFISSSNLAVHVSVATANRWGDITAQPSTTHCDYTVFSSISSEATSLIILTAIGRWK